MNDLADSTAPRTRFAARRLSGEEPLAPARPPGLPEELDGPESEASSAAVLGRTPAATPGSRR